MLAARTNVAYGTRHIAREFRFVARICWHEIHQILVILGAVLPLATMQYVVYFLFCE